jgi:KDO2-lipid IV(A) lauroyltransferase
MRRGGDPRAAVPVSCLGMPLPAQMHKARNQRFRTRAADLEDRKPFEQLPLWLRLLSWIPLPVWYGIATFLAFLLDYVIRSRRNIIEMQLRACFPDKDAAWVKATRHAFFRNFADVSVETVKAMTMKAEEIDRRVTFEEDGPVRAALAAGQSAIIVTSHNCNWEWALLKLCFAIHHPVHAAYKPLKQRFGDRLMLTIRSRFGAEMITARRLLMRVMRYRGPARMIAMIADQAPTSSGIRYFTQFMGLDTAFFIGPEAIAKAGKLPVFYIAMRRVSRGHYCIRFVQIAAAGEELAPGQLIERYAAEVERVTRERPPDWLWNYRRWKVQRDKDGNPFVVKSGLVTRPD